MADQSNGADLLRHHRTVRGASVAALRIRTAEPGLGTTVARFYVAIVRGEASGHEVSNSSLTSGLIRVLEVATRRRHLDEIPPDMGPEMLHATSLGICCGHDYVAVIQFPLVLQGNSWSFCNIISYNHIDFRTEISSLVFPHGRPSVASAASQAA